MAFGLNVRKICKEGLFLKGHQYFECKLMSKGISVIPMETNLLSSFIF